MKEAALEAAEALLDLSIKEELISISDEHKENDQSSENTTGECIC